MRIILLSFYYEPDLCAGSFRATALIEAFKRQYKDNLQIDVLTTLPNRYATFQGSRALENEQDENVFIKRIKLSAHRSGVVDQARSFSYFAWECFNYTHLRDYDLVVATSSRLMTAFLGAMISRTKNIPLYLDIRDLFVDTMGDVFSKKFNSLLVPVFKCIESFTFRSAYRINLVSEGFCEYLRMHYPEQSLSFISNGIDDAFLNLEVADQTSHSATKKIVYAGNIGEGQGLHSIIPALAKKLEGRAEFYIVGDGGRRPQLENKLKQLNVSNVELANPVQRKELIEIYQSADILFLHLNNYDAFRKVLPSKLFEYSVFNKPVWAGVSGYAADFLREKMPGSFIFHPCQVDDAVASFNEIRVNHVDRSDFIDRYKRKNLMKVLVQDILENYQALN